MDIAKSNIVRSLSGRDEGTLYFVLAAEEDFLLLDTIRRIPAEARRDFIRAFRAAMEDYEKKNSSAE